MCWPTPTTTHYPIWLNEYSPIHTKASVTATAATATVTTNPLCNRLHQRLLVLDVHPIPAIDLHHFPASCRAIARLAALAGVRVRIQRGEPFVAQRILETPLELAAVAAVAARCELRATAQYL
jgi:hypothetical protein